VKNDVFYEPLPRRTSKSLFALAVGQALLGLATLHLLMGELYLKIADLSTFSPTNAPNFSKAYRFHCMGFFATILNWPVFVVWVIGWALLGLEMIGLGVMWSEERKASNATGEFVHMSLVGALTRATGPVPADINERGNVIVATVIAGSARYTSSRVVILHVAFAFMLVFGVLSLFLAYVPIRIWLNYRKHELGKDIHENNNSNTETFPEPA
jgi:hypothetical protein